MIEQAPNLDAVVCRKVAAIYARISQDDQSAYSITSQIEIMRRYAEAHGFDIRYEFTEDFTATKLDRPELRKIRDLIQGRQIDVLVVYSSDRFNRGGPAYGQILREELRRADIELHYANRGRVESTPEGEYFSNSEDAANKYWVDKIREASMRGRRRKIDDGIHPGSGLPPYGYCREGRNKDTHFFFHEEQAQVVRNIFRWYADGVSTINIVRRLDGIPTIADLRNNPIKKRRYGEWSVNLLYRMLQNEFYAGVAWVNKEMVIDGKNVPRPREEWISINVPAIIDRELWDYCQLKLSQGRQLSSRNTTHNYLMGRRIRCTCGYSVRGYCCNSRGRKYLYYCCNTHQRYRAVASDKCSTPHFSVGDVDSLVWDFTIKLLSNSEAMIAALRESQNELRKRHADLYERRDTIETQITTNTDELRRLVLALAKTDQGTFYDIIKREADSYVTVLEELAVEKKKINEQLQEVVITDQDIHRLDQFAAEVHARLPNASFEDKRRIIEALNLTATIGIEGEQEKVVYINWHIHTWRLQLYESTSLERAIVKDTARTKGEQDLLTDSPSPAEMKSHCCEWRRALVRGFPEWRYRRGRRP